MTDRLPRRTLIHRRIAYTAAALLSTAQTILLTSELTDSGAPLPLALVAGASLGTVIWTALRPHLTGIGYRVSTARCPEPGCTTSIRKRHPADEPGIPDHIHARVTTHSLHT
ncbi:hypothetical protein [Streptomyces otsuchiensis]|uniref:hypothetical protein n=1 Tax=Streptomyces otsuchiensis TaxID=2681388 RepID=UPI00103175FF|nr:hypothetical protein [Streptomyces otsuchiensis]